MERFYRDFFAKMDLLPKDKSIICESIMKRYSKWLNVEVDSDSPCWQTIELAAKMYEMAADICVTLPDDFCELFPKSVKPEEFYNIAYYSAWAANYNQQYAQFAKLSASFFNSLSFCKMLNGIDSIVESDTDYSEYELYEFLRGLSQKEAYQAISKLNADAETSKELKISITVGDEDSFVDTILKKDIHWQRLCELLSIWSYLKKSACLLQDNGLCDVSNLTINNVKNDTSLVTELRKQGEDFITEHSDVIDTEQYNALSIFFIAAQDDNIERFLNIDYSKLYYHSIYEKATGVLCFNELKRFSSDFESVHRMQKFIDETPDLHKYDEDINLKGCKPDDGLAEGKIKVLEDFKKRFCHEFVIPESNKKNKKKNSEWFDSDRIYSVETMKRVYEILVDENYLEWNANTYMAFLYRTTKDYRPDVSEVQQIRWLGNRPKELISLVRHLFEGSSKINKKLGLFFCDPSGEEYSTNGIKKQEGFTIRMSKIWTQRIEPLL